MRATDERHKSGAQIKEQEVIKEDRGNSKVRSQEDDRRSYCISSIEDTCNCIMCCSKCTVGKQMYRYGCIDFNVRGIACKHIHALHTLQLICNKEPSKKKVKTKLDVDSEESENVKYFQEILRDNSEDPGLIFINLVIESNALKLGTNLAILLLVFLLTVLQSHLLFLGNTLINLRANIAKFSTRQAHKPQ